MKRLADQNKWSQSRELSDTEEIQSSFETLLWRKQSSFLTAQHFSKNQNAIGRRQSQNEDISLSDQKENQSSPATHFTSDNPVELRINTNNQSEKTDSHPTQKSVTITRRSSKPSRHESVPIVTSQTRKRQHDRYKNYRSRLRETQLYSLIVSSTGVDCYAPNCQPSVFNASHRCHTGKTIDSIEKLPLMNDQNIKQNISYISLTNLSNLIDHEPNVSRQDSYSRSASNVLTHKPSLFLADIFNKMTHEQRAKSIAQLTKLHENLTKSNTTIDKLQRTKSLPDLNKKSSKLHSVTSLFSEQTATKMIQSENNTPSISSNKQKRTNKGAHSDHVNLETSSGERTFMHQDDHTSVHSSDTQSSSSPEKLVSVNQLPELKSSEVTAASSPLTRPSSIFIQSNKSSNNTNIARTKTSRSTHFLDTRPDEESIKSKVEQLSNLSNPLKPMTDEDSRKLNEQNLSSKSNEKQNLQDLNSTINTTSKVSSSYNNTIECTAQSKSSMILKEKQAPLSIPRFQSLNGEDEIENSLNDVTDHLSHYDTVILKSSDIPSRESNKTKQTLPLLEKVDEVSQHSEPSHSHLKEATLLITLPIDDTDISIITRTTTASTNLATTDDDDEQSKLINEQLKRSSLGLARDSLELLRNATPLHSNSDEQIIPRTSIENTPQKRKSVLKSRLDSSDNLSTPELISYIAIDDVKGDKSLVEKQMRRRSLTVGGSTVITCISPKPKRDSLVLLQERYSGSMTPHSGCYHLSNSDSRHVEFIREPGDTVTPVLHIGRGTKSKHPSSKPMSPSLSIDHHQQRPISNHSFDTSKRSKSEMSVIGCQQRFKTEAGTRLRRHSLDSASRHQSPRTSLTSTATSFIGIDGIDEEKVCLNKSDYDEMVRLILTPLSKKKKKTPIKPTFESNIEFRINNRLTTFQNLILLILLIFFYIFIFIKSHYWQEHNNT